MFLFRRGRNWYVEYYDESEKKLKRVSTHTSSKPNALKFLADLEKAQSAVLSHCEFIPVKEFSSRYVAYLEATHSTKYARDAKAAFSSLLNFTGDVNLGDLTPKILEEFFLSTFKRAKFNTARHYRTIRAAFTKAVEWSQLTSNPLEHFKFPRLPQNLPLYVTDENLRLINAKVKNETIKAIFEFGFLTGCRQGEILSLRWENVNLTEGVIRIANSAEFTTKSKKERLVPVSIRLRKILLSLSSGQQLPGTLVFGKTATIAYSSNYISRRFKRAVADAELDKRLHFHCLRHGTATELIRRNTPVTVVQKLLGHSNIATTMIYTHVNNDDLMEALKKFDL